MINEKTREQKFQEYVEECNELRNLTPHPITILQGNLKLRYEPFGIQLRIPEFYKTVSEYGGIPITRKTFRKDGVMLPKFEKGVMNIVSTIVARYIAEFHPERIDFVTSGRIIRDRQSGQIKGISSFGFIDKI